jgi:dipeptidyl aminopeptidase/acylaminoacyl peptidase
MRVVPDVSVKPAIRAVLACLVALIAASASAQPARVATFDDVLQVKQVQGAQLSPDGRAVVYTVRQWEADGERMESRTRVWRVAADGQSPARQLAYGERGDSQPQWSPDGRFISFLSARGAADARPQLYVLPADGGEAQKITESKEGVTAYAWAPDSARIAYVSTDPRTADEDAAIRRRDDERVFEGDFRYQHLWMVTVPLPGAPATADAGLRLTEGTAYTVQGAPSWAPDGTRLVFTGAATPMLRDNRRDVYVLTLDPRGVEKISTNFGSDGAPRWSSDGRTIAWTMEPHPMPPHADGTAIGPVVQSKLVLYDVATRRARDVSSPAFDTDAGTPVWTLEGQRVMFTAGKRAYTEAFAYDVSTGRYTQLTTGRTLQGLSVSRDGRTIAFTMETPDAAAEVFVTDPSFSRPRRLTSTNPQLGEIRQGRTEVITWKGHDGLEVEGVLLLPVDDAPGRRYPLLVVAHGGPAGAYVNGFRLGGLEGGQVWAGRGWAVFYPNPRGSTNYGERTLQANVNDWGGGDYRDIMTGVDALVARGLADPDRLAHIGWSYGGYMTAWMITQTTRFKAAMVGAGLTNMWSMYGTNDIPSVLISYFGGIPNAKTLPLYLERSAMSHIDKVTTPTLILHGANDERVPTGQAHELYRGLKDRAIPTELVFYPREGHGIQEYHHQKDRLERIHDWVTRHTLGVRP